MRKFVLLYLVFVCAAIVQAQSGRVNNYSESQSSVKNAGDVKPAEKPTAPDKDDDEVIRVDTDLVLIPAQITDRRGKPVSDIKREEFKIFKNNVEQEIAYFSGDEQPFTVALVLDMSYSSVFKLEDIQAAAFAFIRQLRPDDRVMIVSFDEKVRVLCKPTNNRKVLQLAIEAAKIASGTSLYTALDTVLNDEFNHVNGRKAIILLSDGVDTSSQKATAETVLQTAAESDALVFPIVYDTYDDVQKSRKKDAQVFYDEDDRPYVVERPRVKGEREEDYREADYFTKDLANKSGGRIYQVSSTANLNQAFAKIADELRKVYLLGYYPNGGDSPPNGTRFGIRVRVYRPGLNIRAKDRYVFRQNDTKK